MAGVPEGGTFEASTRSGDAARILTTLSLYTLGTPRIHDPSGALHTPLVRRRALALVAIAAGAGFSGIERDRLTALLWPDCDGERGRNNLRQTLFTLRRMFGRDVFKQDTAALRINPSVLQVDAWDFEAAVAARQDETAAALYGGPFMADFTVPGLDALDRWLDAQRSRMQAMARTVFERLIRAARQAGDREGALRWARALAAMEPLSSRAALEMLVALAAVGDRAGALAYARAYETELKVQLDTVPDAHVTRYITQLRQLPGWDGAERRARPPEPRTSAAAAKPPQDVPVPLDIAHGHPAGTDLRLSSPLQRALFELVHVAPAYLSLAESHDAHGERAEAMKHYETFLRLCRDADLEAQLKIAYIESRLATLKREIAMEPRETRPTIPAPTVPAAAD